MKKSLAQSALNRNKNAVNPQHKKIHQALDFLATEPAKSLQIMQELLASDPSNPLLWVIATKANQRLGQFFAADECIKEALTLSPDYVEAIYAKSDLLYRSDRLDEAEVFLSESVQRLDKESCRPLRSLHATVLQKSKKYEEAQQIYSELTQESPNNWLFWNNLGMVNQDLSQFEEMNKAYQKSCEATKDNPTPYFNQIVGAHYDPSKTADDIKQLCQIWQTKFKPTRVIRAEAKDKRADKRIRIGLISDGLRSHPVGQMITTGLSHIQESQIEFYAYSTNYKEDHLTHRIKRMCAKWMVIEHVSPDELNKIIRKDDIDILFDLSGYNSNSRMQTMQQAPAPIQIKWVGGLISTTGLETMDYLLSDSIETPEGYDDLYTEKLIRMPDDYICYEPPFYLPPVSDNPVIKNGYITFGCFNNASKINEPLLEQWAKLLNAVPDSRLFLKSFNFDNLSLQENVFATLAKHGIDRKRIRIEGGGSHQALLSSYDDVDIALDPWPYSGGLTTCEAMAMGVPVITLPGPTFAGRHSASHLVNAGLKELVATDWQNYIDIAVGLTHDLNSLTIIRKNLREILLQSPVCDGVRFANNFTVAMRAVWQRYCEGKQPEALTLINDAAPYFHGDNLPMDLKMPKNADVSLAKAPEREFTFQLAGKLMMMDFGGAFAASKKIISLAELNAFFFIIMDTLGAVDDNALPLRRKSIQHIKLHALGNGEIAPVYMCLDNNLSSTLKPLSGESQGATILAEISTQTSKLDEIHGLDGLDLLAIDNKYNLNGVFEHGKRILRSCLAIEVKVGFIDTHQEQMPFSNIKSLLHEHGFDFHAFIDIEYAQLLSNEKLATMTPSKMAGAKALFIPNISRLAALNNGEREKLAFILHSVYGMKDAAYNVFSATSLERADDYLASLNGAESTTTGSVSPVEKTIIPVMPRMTDSEIDLFKQQLIGSKAYFEFGSGGSTKLATRNNVTVHGVESDKFWVDTLHKEAGELCKVEYVDIGPTKEWGYPVDDSHKEKFGNYSEAILKYDQAFDFILVDGRFRVACTLNAIKHTLTKQKQVRDTRIFIHDFWNRADYHDVLEFLDTEHVVESAGVFRIKPNINLPALDRMLEKYKHVAS